MEFEWDDDKNAVNIVKHSVSFGVIEGFNWASALIALNQSHNTKERRFTAVGYIRESPLCVYLHMAWQQTAHH